ncbi:MAG TPA: methylated-DNA--[protein]-cysteine S-methyltransferase [Nitrospirota bacterium]|nr:methylated-DNA--[protein]-cysteine S-methyltransferase [Nitrospirota bacterium]
MQKQEAAWLTFPTSLGNCGVSWDAQGITSFFLPESAGKRVETRLKRMTKSKRASAVPPSWIKELTGKVIAHLKGEAQDFSNLPVHFIDISEFMRSVYRSAQKIRSGEVVTYSEMAARIGKPNAARAVGAALGKNPIPLVVPCHRVVASQGKLGGYSAPGGVETKAALLELEGVSLKKSGVIATPALWQKATKTLQKKDKSIARLIKKVGPLQFQPLLKKEPLAALIQAITSQQLSSKAAGTILNRVNALITEDGHPDPTRILNTADADLRKAGLSLMKVSFLKDLARKYLEGKLSPLEKLKEMSDEQIIKEFTQIKGVGRWTVEMYLIFNLGRADIFPTLDFGIRKAVAQLYGLSKVPEPKDIEKYGERWKPYRSVASLYLWYSMDNK